MIGLYSRLQISNTKGSSCSNQDTLRLPSMYLGYYIHSVIGWEQYIFTCIGMQLHISKKTYGLNMVTKTIVATRTLSCNGHWLGYVNTLRGDRDSGRFDLPKGTIKDAMGLEGASDRS